MKEILEAILAAVVILALAAFILGWPVMWLWNNCLIEAIDGVHKIGLWQAVGLNFLVSILFKSTSSKQ